MIISVNNLLLARPLFGHLHDHDIERTSINEDLHSTQLIKRVAEYYFQIRLCRYGQEYTTNVLKKSSIGMRQQTNKILLFKGL